MRVNPTHPVRGEDLDEFIRGDVTFHYPDLQNRCDLTVQECDSYVVIPVIPTGCVGVIVVLTGKNGVPLNEMFIVEIASRLVDGGNEITGFHGSHREVFIVFELRENLPQDPRYTPVVGVTTVEQNPTRFLTDHTTLLTVKGKISVTNLVLHVTHHATNGLRITPKISRSFTSSHEIQRGRLGFL